MKSKSMFVAGFLALSASATLVACNKEANTATPANSSASIKNLARIGGGPCKVYDEKTGNCPESQLGGCEEGTVTAPRYQQLNAAISLGGPAVAQLFSDQATALAIIPNFNAAYFADEKEAILSGQYNFDRVENANGVFYLLGPDGNIDHSNPYYALKYQVVQ